MSNFDSRMKKRLDTDHGLSVKDPPRKFDGMVTREHSSPSSVSRSSFAGDNSSKKGSLGELGSVDIEAETATRKSCCSFGAIFCAVFVYEDCRKQDDAADQQGSEEALFCTLCNAQVTCIDKYVMSIINLDVHI